MLVALLLYLFLSLLLISSMPIKKSKSILILSIVLPIFSLICALIFFVADYFSGEGIDERVIFHIKMGIVGIDLIDYLPLIIGSISFLLVFIIITYSLINKQKFSGVLSNKLYVFIIFLLYLNPTVLNFSYLYGRQYFDQLYPEDISKYYSQLQRPDKNIQLDKKYVIVLYLESLEKAFYDDQLFPNLMPFLKNITENNLTFTQVNQVSGTGFTIGGIVASQCGIPLLSADQTGQTYQNIWNDFLVQEYCLGDFFRDSNYINYFVGGADYSFAGKQKFFLSHGFFEENIIGSREFEMSFKEQGVLVDHYRSQWGFYDEVVLDKILNIYNNGDEQQYIVGLTLGTHHPGDLISPYCKKNFNKYESVYLNILSCTDSNLEKFITAIKNSPKAEDTLLVIASDHLAMNNEFLNDLQNLQSRENLLTVIDFSNPNKKIVNKPASTLDTGATLLAILNSDETSLGLGRSLLQNIPTLVEIFQENVNRVLSSWANILHSDNLMANMKKDVLSLSLRENKIGVLTTNVFPLFITYNLSDGNLVNGIGGFDKHPLAGRYTDYYSVQLMYENLQDSYNLLGLNSCKDIQNIMQGKTKILLDLNVQSQYCYIHFEDKLNDQLYIQVGEVPEKFEGSLNDLLSLSNSSIVVNKYEFLLALKNLILNPQLFQYY